jgi:oligosaccharide amylase
MPREVVLGNGRLTVALDQNANIKDLSYPKIGLENHVKGHPFRIGVWADDTFSWIGDDWSVSSKYLPDTAVSKSYAVNAKMQIELKMDSAVYGFLDLFLRKIQVTNQSTKNRELRVFFSHDFHIYGEDYGDTSFFEPSLKAIIHYKRKRYFLINGTNQNGEGIFEFATGQKEAFGREGTWRDAEDGKLEQNPIAQGSVDSTVSFKLQMPPKSSANLYYWIACGKHIDEVKELNETVRQEKVERLLIKTEDYWSAWTNRRTIDLSILPRATASLVKRSLLTMRNHVGNNGAIISSIDSEGLNFNRDTYAYVWPRDAAICAMAFDVAGFQEISRSFFSFCSKVISKEGYFAHKYWSDGSAGSSWHALIDESGNQQLPIQIDETALVLLALWKHFEKYQDVEFISKIYPKLVVNTSDFLKNYINLETGLPKPSFDIWEERAGTFTATSSCVCAALFAASKFSEAFFDRKRQRELKGAAEKMKAAILNNLYDKKLQRFIRGIYPNGEYDTTIDSSLLFTFLSGTFDARDKQVTYTVQAVEENLWSKTPTGGLARYENDGYYRAPDQKQGNPWIICTMWLARWYIANATSKEDLVKPLELLSWASKNGSSTGILPEQIEPHSGNPISISPLTWSHAEYVLAAAEYVERYKKL